MATKKISELTAATTPLAGTEQVPIVQAGATVRATVAEIVGPWKTVTVTTAQQDIDFTGLDLDADKMYRLEVVMVVNAAADQTTKMFFNTDYTDANYDSQSLVARGTSVTAGRNALAWAMFGYSASGTGTVLTCAATISKSSGKSPAVLADSTAIEGGDINRLMHAMRWTGTSNVTSIKLRHANNFGAGTVARLYKA